MILKETLRAIGTVVLEEIERNPDFAQRLQLALTTTASALVGNNPEGAERTKKRHRSRAPAVIDPIATLSDHGDDALRHELQALPLDKLLDIVAEFAMDPSKLVMKWKSQERIIDHIIDNAKRRSVKGDAFRR
ncbi:hypothetical protein [Noviherbaspirillum denitrificans]|uniref:Uncharacterized protein n=1 Tax=Noviherbaspirillum denitrificans TaxID=1968433 RepID=A0A254T6U6_9BURK|nr:hypothetical protein [Noviherbaspirillum denitrificans]OWW18356.1 hypothetical protein AYR66_01170 [Noviherbaspirillum denitrificans]